ncbi:hypothetical protein PRIPAC_73575 [Pristionchus pacificus]|uniref:Srd-4 n=1 Tax=Pristionchus pacificus TaxID=54126 RepID=A0A2A6CGB2_PRIPA|nr:hypothetical protein PRIPAC_73575 [Pristionchus pacificus]|eukprot:PDM77254.1 srd-4 [Pristionchus pacificus]
MHLTPLDALSITVYSISGYLGISANILLLIAIKYRSPASWKSYTILLTNCALIDLVACISTSMSIERFVPFKLVTTSVYLGPCSHILHSIMLHSVTQSLFLIIIALCYRLYVLGHPPPSKLNMVIFCIVVYIPTFGILVASFFTNDPPNEVREALKQMHPEHEQFEEYVVEGHVDTKPVPLARFIQASMIGPIVPLCILVFIVRKKVINKINAKADVMTERTKEMHKSLVKYLSFMPAIAPFITLYNMGSFRNKARPFVVSFSRKKDQVKVIFHRRVSFLTFQKLIIEVLCMILQLISDHHWPVLTIIDSPIFSTYFKMNLTTLDIMSICVYSTSGFLGIAGNAILLLAIKFRSPSSWKSYTILLANCAMIDFVACFSTWMSIERFVPFKQVTTSVYLGPCTLVSGFACHILHSIMLHSVTHSLFLIVVAFCYRLYVLGRSPPSKKNMIIFCIAIYAPTFSILVASFFTNDPPDVVREGLKLLHPDHDQFEGYVIEGHVDLQPRPLSKFIMAYMIGPIIPLCILVFFVRQKVIGKIKSKEDVMTERTKEMHKSLVKVLTLQASLPIFFLLSVITFVIVKRQLSNSPFFEHSLFWYISFMPALSPLITIYNVGPFRNFVLGKGPRLSTVSSAPICGFIGIIGNASLLLAIRYRSPSSWRSYTILLTNCSLIDLLACFCSCMSIERTAPFKFVTVSVYLGPCTFISGFFCHCLHATLVHTLAQSLFLIVLAFYYRLYVIGRTAPSRRKMILFCVAIYIPTFAVLLMTFFTNDPPGEVRKVLKLYYPNHDQFEGYVIEGHVDIQPHLWIRIVQAYMILPVFPLSIIVFVVRQKVINKLRAKETAMAKRTKDMHHSLVKYMSLMPAMAPFITLYNVKPLRNFVLMRSRVSSKSSAPISIELYPSAMTVLDIISIVIHSTTGVYGIIGNIALLAAIKFRSPPSWKSYSILLANCALIDIVACASTSLTIERMIVFSDMTANVYLGPCTLVSGFFCHILHSMMLQTNSHSLFMIVIAFCYRYYVIGRSAPKPVKVLIFCMAIYVPTITVVTIGLFLNDPSDLVREAFRVNHPDHQLDDYFLEGHVDFQPKPLSVVIQLYMIRPIIPLLIIVFIVIDKLKEREDVMTMRTKEMHKSLVKVLTLQASLPIFFFLSIFCYVLVKKKICTSIVLEYAITWFHPFMTSLAPVITLINVKPFRE